MNDSGPGLSPVVPRIRRDSVGMLGKLLCPVQAPYSFSGDPELAILFPSISKYLLFHV